MKKGFSSEKDLWLHDVAYLVYKTLKKAEEQDEIEDLLKHLKKVLKFIKKHVSPLR